MNTVVTRSIKVLEDAPSSMVLSQETEDEETLPQLANDPIPPTPLPYNLPVPFPQRFAKVRLEKRCGKFLQLVRDYS